MIAPGYPESRQLLAGKAVLITAAAGTGIGQAAAKRCIEEGARVSEALLSELTARAALGRSADPCEIANVIVFLASELSSYLTGEVIWVRSQHA